MTAAIAVALLVGVLPSVAQEEHAAHAPAAAAAPAPDASAPAPAPPPPDGDKKDEGKPTEAAVNTLFGNPAAWSRYQALSEADRKGFDEGFKAFKNQDLSKDLPGDWFRRWNDEFSGKAPPKATEAGEQALRRAGETAGRCSSEASNDPNCKPVPREQPDPKNPPKLEDATETDRPNVGGPQVPVPDVKFEKEAAPAPNTAYRDLIRNGAFGAMAGALVGIGLLPLLGPMGIIVGAMMGAGVMVVGKKLTG